MQTIAVDGRLGDLFAGAREKVEVRDHQGKLLGQFTPQSVIDLETIDFVKSQVDLQALQQRKREQHGKGITTDSLLQKLEALERQE